MTADLAASPRQPRGSAPAAAAAFSIDAGQLLACARDGVVITDGQGRVTEWNPSTERMLGWLRAQAVGRPLSDLIVPVQPIALNETDLASSLRRVAERSVDGLLELEVRHREGRSLMLELSVFSLPASSGEATGLFLRDGSSRRSTDQALRQSEERYRAVVEHLSEGMVVVQDEKVVYANPRAAEIVDMPLAQMQQIGFLTRVHPQDQALVLDRQRRRLAGEQPPDHYELRVLLPGDVVRWIAVGVAVVPWDGKPAALILFTDITERKRMQEEIRASEERLRAVVEQAGEGTLVVIETDKPVFVNRRALEILRMTREALDQRGYLHLLHPDDLPMVLERRRRRLAGDAVVGRYEVRLLDADGALRWIDMGTTLVPWSGRTATLTFFSDVTDRKMLLEAMHRSEERYRAVVEHAGEGMAVVQDGVFVFANQRALQIARRARHDLIGHGELEHVHPDDRGLALDRQRRRQAGEAVPPRDELRLLHADGSISWIEVGATVVPWEGKSASLVFFSDVSQRKALEARLRDTLAEREAILEHSQVGIAFLTQHRKLRWANHAMAQIFGRDAALHEEADWSGVDFSSIFPVPADYARASAQVAERMRARLAFEGELQLCRSDGRLFWASVTGKAVNVRDAAHGTVWTVMDITERKELEVALKRTSSEREAIFANVLVGIAFNVNRQIRWVNDKFVEMMGYSRAELTDQSSRMLYPDDESYAREGMLTVQHLRRDGAYTSERQLVRKNGERIWVQMAGRCVFGKDPEAGAIWTFLDVTDRRSVEDGVRAALERQQELNMLRSHFVAMTSHEFRSPLATILSSSELIRHYGDRMSEVDKQEVLDGVASGVQRMTSMLDRMLLIGRADAQMLEFQPLLLDLRALCQRCVGDVCNQFPARADDLVLEYACARRTGEFDEKLLRHVLGNLLTNAVKYSPAGSVVRLRVTNEGDAWAFEVADHGIGIPVAEHSRLFELFHRASNVGDIPGTGLGLAIVKKAVDAHRGSIEVRSELGSGCCFRVVLR